MLAIDVPYTTSQTLFQPTSKMTLLFKSSSTMVITVTSNKGTYLNADSLKTQIWVDSSTVNIRRTGDGVVRSAEPDEVLPVFDSVAPLNILETKRLKFRIRSISKNPPIPFFE